MSRAGDQVGRRGGGYAVIDQAYLTTYGKDAEDQVRAAGFRLAHLINQALDPAYQGPVKNRTQP